MNYRHAFHAGNFADVMKHAALVSALLHLRRKDTPFAVIDMHAGRGLYELAGAEAAKTGEAAQGIARFAEWTPQNAALAKYLEIARSFGADRYPGSPLVAAKLLRPQDRLVAIEKQPEESAALKSALADVRNARAEAGDGYARLAALLPPAERRGLVLIDPPFEAAGEFEALARVFAAARHRFATGIYMLWYPLKLASDADALAGEIRNAGPAKLLSLVLDVGRRAEAPPARLSAAGLLVVNPPFGFDREMRAVLSEILPRLEQGEGAQFQVTWLAGEG